MADTVLENLIDLADEYVRQEVRVSIKTNLGPEIPVFRGSMSKGGGDSSGAPSSGGGLGSLIGFKAAVIVRKKDGNVLTTIGDPPPTDPVRTVITLGLLLLVGYVFVRGLLR